MARTKTSEFAVPVLNSSFVPGSPAKKWVGAVSACAPAKGGIGRDIGTAAVGRINEVKATLAKQAVAIGADAVIGVRVELVLNGAVLLVIGHSDAVRLGPINGGQLDVNS